MNQSQKIKELSGLNEDFQNYFNNTIIPQLFFDKDLVLRKFTPAAMKQFKLSASDIGRTIHEIVNNLRYPSIVENIKWVNAKSQILEEEIQTSDLSWYQMNIIPYLLSDGSQNGVIITFIDITSRVKDLKEQEKIIAEYETLLDTISHDVKNRLHSMMLSIDMVKSTDYSDRDELEFCAQTLESGISKIHRIIEELFESRDQKHKYQAVDELLNIEHIFEDVKFALINEISNSNASIHFEVNASEIQFPRRHLRSIIYNLVSNSIKFRSPKRDPEILISTVKQDDYMLITVKDNGIGIDPQNHDAVFSKFFRVENSVEGSGVGLHLVATLVKNSGGRVEIESELGVGTEFKVYLKSGCSSIN